MPAMSLEENKRLRRRLKFQITRLMNLYDANLAAMPADIVNETPDNRRLLGLDVGQPYPKTQEDLRLQMARLIDKYIDGTEFSQAQKDRQAIVQDFKVLKAALSENNAAWNNPAAVGSSLKISDRWKQGLSKTRIPTQIENRLNGMKKIEMFQNVALYTEAMDASTDPTIKDAQEYRNLAVEINDEIAKLGANADPLVVHNKKLEIAKVFAENAVYPKIMGADYGYVKDKKGSNIAQNPIPEADTEKLHYLTLAVLGKIENKAVATMTSVEKIQHDRDGKVIMENGQPVTATKFNVHVFGETNEPPLTTNRMFHILMTENDVSGVAFKKQLDDVGLVVKVMLDEKNRPFLRFRYKDGSVNGAPLIASATLTQAQVNHLKAERDAIMNRMLASRFTQVKPSDKYVYQVDRDAALIVVNAAKKVFDERVRAKNGIDLSLERLLSRGLIPDNAKKAMCKGLLSTDLNPDRLQELQDALKNLKQHKDNYRPVGAPVDVDKLIDELRVQIADFSQDRQRVQDWADINDEALSLRGYEKFLTTVANEITAIQRLPQTRQLIDTGGRSELVFKDLINIHELVTTRPVQKNENNAARTKLIADITAAANGHLDIISKKIVRQQVQPIRATFEDIKEDLEIGRTDILTANAMIDVGVQEVNKWIASIDSLSNNINEPFIQNTDGYRALQETRQELVTLRDELNVQLTANNEAEQLNSIEARYNAILAGFAALVPPVTPLNINHYQLSIQCTDRLKLLKNEQEAMLNVGVNRLNRGKFNNLSKAIADSLIDMNNFMLLKHDYIKCDISQSMDDRLPNAAIYATEVDQAKNPNSHPGFDNTIDVLTLNDTIDKTLNAIENANKNNSDPTLIDALDKAGYITHRSLGFMKGRVSEFNQSNRLALIPQFKTLNELDLSAITASLEPTPANLLAFAKNRAAVEARNKLMDQAERDAKASVAAALPGKVLNETAEIAKFKAAIPLANIIRAEQKAMAAVTAANMPADTAAYAKQIAADAFVQIHVGEEYYRKYTSARSALNTIKDAPVTLTKGIGAAEVKVKMLDSGDAASASRSMTVNPLSGAGAGHIVDASTNIQPLFESFSGRLHGKNNKRTMVDIFEDIKTKGPNAAATPDEGLLALRLLSARFNSDDKKLAEDINAEIDATYTSALKFMQAASKKDAGTERAALSVTTLYYEDEKNKKNPKARDTSKDNDIDTNVRDASRAANKEDLVTPVNVVAKRTTKQVESLKKQAIQFGVFAAEARNTFIARYPEHFKGNWSNRSKLTEDEIDDKIAALESSGDPVIEKEAKRVLDFQVAVGNFNSNVTEQLLMLQSYQESANIILQDILGKNNEITARFANPEGRILLDGLKEDLSVAQLQEFAKLFDITEPVEFEKKLEEFRVKFFADKVFPLPATDNVLRSMRAGIRVSSLAFQSLVTQLFNEYNATLAVARQHAIDKGTHPPEMTDAGPGDRQSFIYFVNQLDDSTMNAMMAQVSLHPVDFTDPLSDGRPALDELAANFANGVTPADELQPDDVLQTIFGAKNFVEAKAEHPKLYEIAGVLVMRRQLQGSNILAVTNDIRNKEEQGSRSFKPQNKTYAFTGADVETKNNYLVNLMKVLDIPATTPDNNPIKQALIRYIELNNNANNTLLINDVLTVALDEAAVAFDDKNTQRRMGGEPQTTRDERYHLAMLKLRNAIAKIEMEHPDFIKLDDSVKRLIHAKAGENLQSAIAMDNLTALLDMIAVSVRDYASKVPGVAAQHAVLDKETTKKDEYDMVGHVRTSLTKNHPTEFDFRIEIPGTEKSISFAEMIRDPAYIKTSLAILVDLLKEMRNQNNLVAEEKIRECAFNALADLAVAHELDVIKQVNESGTNGFSVTVAAQQYAALGFTKLDGSKLLFGNHVNYHPTVVNARYQKDLNHAHDSYVDAIAQSGADILTLSVQFIDDLTVGGILPANASAETFALREKYLKEAAQNLFFRDQDIENITEREDAFLAQPVSLEPIQNMLQFSQTAGLLKKRTQYFKSRLDALTAALSNPAMVAELKTVNMDGKAITHLDIAKKAYANSLAEGVYYNLRSEIKYDRKTLAEDIKHLVEAKKAIEKNYKDSGLDPKASPYASHILNAIENTILQAKDFEYGEIFASSTPEQNIVSGLELIRYFVNFELTDSKNATYSDLMKKSESEYNKSLGSYADQLDKKYKVINGDGFVKYELNEIEAHLGKLSTLNLKTLESDIVNLTVIIQSHAGALSEMKIAGQFRVDLQNSLNVLSVLLANLQAQREIVVGLIAAGNDPIKRLQAFSQLNAKIDACYPVGSVVATHELSQQNDLNGWVTDQFNRIKADLKPETIGEDGLKGPLALLLGVGPEDKAEAKAIEDFEKAVNSNAERIELKKTIIATLVAHLESKDISGDKYLEKLQRQISMYNAVVPGFDQLLSNKLKSLKASASSTSTATASTATSSASSSSSSSSSASMLPPGPPPPLSGSTNVTLNTGSSSTNLGAGVGSGGSSNSSSSSSSSSNSSGVSSTSSSPSLSPNVSPALSTGTVDDLDNDVLDKDLLIEHLVSIFGLEIPYKTNRPRNNVEDQTKTVKPKRDLTKAQAAEIKAYIDGIWSLSAANAIKSALDKHHTAYEKRKFFDSSAKQKAESDALVVLRDAIGQHENDHPADLKLGQYWKDLLEDRADDLAARTVNKAQRNNRVPVPRPYEVLQAEAQKESEKHTKITIPNLRVAIAALKDIIIKSDNVHTEGLFRREAENNVVKNSIIKAVKSDQLLVNLNNLVDDNGVSISSSAIDAVTASNVMKTLFRDLFFGKDHTNLGQQDKVAFDNVIETAAIVAIQNALDKMNGKPSSLINSYAVAMTLSPNLNDSNDIPAVQKIITDKISLLLGTPPFNDLINQAQFEALDSITVTPTVDALVRNFKVLFALNDTTYDAELNQFFTEVLLKNNISTSEGSSIVMALLANKKDIIKLHDALAKFSSKKLSPALGQLVNNSAAIKKAEANMPPKTQAVGTWLNKSTVTKDKLVSGFKHLMTGFYNDEFDQEIEKFADELAAIVSGNRLNNPQPTESIPVLIYHLLKEDATLDGLAQAITETTGFFPEEFKTFATSDAMNAIRTQDPLCSNVGRSRAPTLRGSFSEAVTSTVTTGASSSSSSTESSRSRITSFLPDGFGSVFSFRKHSTATSNLPSTANNSVVVSASSSSSSSSTSNSDGQKQQLQQKVQEERIKSIKEKVKELGEFLARVDQLNFGGYAGEYKADQKDEFVKRVDAIVSAQKLCKEILEAIGNDPKDNDLLAIRTAVVALQKGIGKDGNVPDLNSGSPSVGSSSRVSKTKLQSFEDLKKEVLTATELDRTKLGNIDSVVTKPVSIAKSALKPYEPPTQSVAVKI